METPIVKDDENSDGIDRRGFLSCMAWAGTGVLWTLSGGILTSASLKSANAATGAAKGDLSFIQISDSHIGFSKAPNKDVTATLQQAVAKINAQQTVPAFVLHTGDITHLSKPEEFDTADQVIKSIKTSKVFYVPGEHDVIDGTGKQYLERYGKGTQGTGWYSFDQNGVHFIGLNNVLQTKAAGLGFLGDEQLEWLEKDVSGLSKSTPIVVFAHVPLWMVYPEWGWGTDDAARALSYLKDFGSVTVLNGHIHQTVQKVEGNMTFHTALSTAFPQPAPGVGPAPGPIPTVAGERLRSMLGLTNVNFVVANSRLAVIDSSLDPSGAISKPGKDDQASAPGKKPAVAGANQINISNFKFDPAELTVPVGTEVTWINHDGEPHRVVSTEQKFKSNALDSNDRFSYKFTAPGSYAYFCSIHPHMTGKVIVQ